MKNSVFYDPNVLATLLDKQEAYDAVCFKARGVDDGYLALDPDQILLAFFDEFGETIHSAKSRWCWWKQTQEPEDREHTLEELADMLHFALLYMLRYVEDSYESLDECAHYTESEEWWVSSEIDRNLVNDMSESPARLSHAISELCYLPYFGFILFTFRLARYLGFSDQELLDAYDKKNAENYKRMETGY